MNKWLIMFDPLLFKDLADKLQNNIGVNSSSEEAMRTIINRLYYSIYLYIRDKLCEKHKYRSLCENEIDKHPSQGPHELVINSLKIKNYDASNKLYELFELRKVADYKMKVTITSSKVVKGYSLYNEIFNIVKNL